MSRLEVLAQGQRLLVEGTASKSLQIEQSEEIQETVLKGMKLGRSVSLEDSEDFSREVLVNSAKKLGYNLKSADVERLLQGNLQTALSMNLESVANLSADAMAIGSLEGAKGSVGGAAVSLISTTKEALEDGKLTATEIGQMGVSAAKTAGTILSMAAGNMAMGPVGAIASIPMAGIGLLQAEISAQEEIDRQARQFAAEYIASEQSQINSLLQQAGMQFSVSRGLAWNEADRIVEFLSNSWRSLEQDLGVSFDLRFFANESIPPKGGLWTWGQTSTSSTGICHRPAVPPGGQLYFPVSQDRYYLSEKGCTSNNKALRTKEGKYRFAGHEKVARVVRALNSFFPETDTTSFWYPEEASERSTASKWAGYEDIIYWEIRDRERGTKNSINFTSELPTVAQKNHAMEEYEILLIAYYKGQISKLPEIGKRTLKYIEWMFGSLVDEADKLQTYRLRVYADIVQTASAVKAEIEVAKSMYDFVKKVGTMSSGGLTQADKRSMVFSASSNLSYGKALLWVGASALCVGGYSYLKRRGHV